MGRARIWRREDLIAFFHREIREHEWAPSTPRDDKVFRYISEMLANFASFDYIYRIRNSAGVQLTQVAEMLMEGDIRLNADSFAREREVHRHIGDFTLFWTGVYPEGIRRLTANRPDSLIDYVRQGKHSYYIASTFDLGRFKDEAPLFRTLSERFENFMEGLQRLRSRWLTSGRLPSEPGS